MEAELVEVQAMTETARRVTARADQIAATLQGIAVQTQETVRPILNTVANLGRTLRRGAAVYSGLKAGLGALRRHREEDGEAE